MFRRRCSPATRETASSADEVRGLVDAAAAGVGGDLRIRTQRTRAIDGAAGPMRRDDAYWRLALLDPLLDGARRVESVGSFAAAAMPHARRHEERHRRARSRGAKRLDHAVVVVDARQ